MKLSIDKPLYAKIINNSLYILLGVFMTCFTNYFEFVLIYFIGGFLLVSGIIEVVMFFLKRQETFTIGFDLILGGIKAVIGTFCMTMSYEALWVVSLLFGLYLIAISFFPLVFNVMLASNGGKINLWNLGLHILTMATGICLLFYNEAMTHLLSICGILIIARGIFGIVVAVTNYNRKKKVMNIIQNEFKTMIKDNNVIDCEAEVSDEEKPQ